MTHAAEPPECGEIVNPFSKTSDTCSAQATHRVTLDGVRNVHRPFTGCASCAQRRFAAMQRAYKHDATARVTIEEVYPHDCPDRTNCQMLARHMGPCVPLAH